MDPNAKPEETPSSEPPPYSPGTWSYPTNTAGQAAPGGGYPQPGGYPPPQNPAYPPTQGGIYPPPTNYPAYPPGQSAQVTLTTTTTALQQHPNANQVVLVNGCPNCRTGVLEEHFSTCGVILAIFCFPIGILCCLVMRERTCTNCRATFS